MQHPLLDPATKGARRPRQRQQGYGVEYDNWGIPVDDPKAPVRLKINRDNLLVQLMRMKRGNSEV